MNKKDLELIKCLLTDAVECLDLFGWAEVRAVRKDKNGYVSSFSCRDAGYAGSKVSAWAKVNPKKISIAAFHCREGDLDVGRDIAAQFVDKVAVWDYDMYGIDCLIQYIVLGKVIY